MYVQAVINLCRAQGDEGFHSRNHLLLYHNPVPLLGFGSEKNKVKEQQSWKEDNDLVKNSFNFDANPKLAPHWKKMDPDPGHEH